MHHTLSFAILCGVLTLSACLPRSPETHYYILNADPTSNMVQLRQTATRTLQLRSIHLPEYLDRNGIVWRQADGVSLEVSGLHLWGEPLKDGVHRTLITAMTLPLNKAGYIVQHTDEEKAALWFNVDILRFEGTPHGNAVLDARFTLEHADKGILLREQRIFTAPAGETAASLVLAQSHLLQELGTVMSTSLIQKVAQ